MKNLLLILIISLIFISGCTSPISKNEQITQIPTTINQNSIFTATPTPTPTQIPTQVIIVPTLTQSQFPYFKSADIINGSWTWEDNTTKMLLIINNDSLHHFILKIYNKYDDDESIYPDITGKVIQITTCNFQLTTGSDFTKTGKQNDAMRDLSRFQWYYDNETGNIISVTTDDVFTYYPKINWRDFDPIHVQTNKKEVNNNIIVIY